jgi:hypothetical protein
MRSKDTRKEVAVSPKIDSATAAFYDENFPSRNAGVACAIEILPPLYRSALAEMRGRFSAGELSMILDVQNGSAAIMVYGQGGLAGQHLPLSLADSFHLYPGAYEEKWQIADPQGFLARVAALTRFQVAALEIWAAAFWEKHLDSTPVEDYCAQLLGAQNVR